MTGTFRRSDARPTDALAQVAVLAASSCALVVLLISERCGAAQAGFAAAAITLLFIYALLAWVAGALLVLRRGPMERFAGASLCRATLHLAPAIYWAVDLSFMALGAAVLFVGFKLTRDVVVWISLAWGAGAAYTSGQAVAEALVWVRGCRKRVRESSGRPCQM